MVEAATKGLHLARSRYKAQADLRRREVCFEIGERVWLQLRPEQYHSSISRKFAPRYAGPYRILRYAHKDNPVSVVLNTPESMGVGKSYHVSRLKKFVEDSDPNRQQVLRPDAILVDGVEEFEVEAILNHWFVCKAGKQVLEYLVKWTGYDHIESTWELEDNLGSALEVLGSYRKRSGLPPLWLGTGCCDYACKLYPGFTTLLPLEGRLKRVGAGGCWAADLQSGGQSYLVLASQVRASWGRPLEVLREGPSGLSD